MTVKVKFKQSGQFHSGVFKSLDLDKISKFQINHLRNTFELLATTPENPTPDTPYVLAIRDRQYELQEMINDLQKLKQKKENVTYEITDTEAHLISS